MVNNIGYIYVIIFVKLYIYIHIWRVRERESEIKWYLIYTSELFENNPLIIVYSFKINLEFVYI